MNDEDRRIRSLRPPLERPQRLDRPLGVVVEEERTPRGSVRSATVFLAGAECPFTCAFCDLWRHTIPGPTPPGALPAQLDVASRTLEELERGELAAREPAASRSYSAAVEQLKLYNASNFFEPRAVPDADREAILARIRRFERVVVESHPRLLGERAAWWADRLGSRLEVAIGLETVHPEALARLNKGARLDDVERAAGRLEGLGLGLRCFVLIGVPRVAAPDQVEWVRRTVEHAAALGARVTSLIPVRGGNGELERLRAEGAWRPPDLGLVEDALDAALVWDRGHEGGMTVQADPWDLERLAVCRGCASARLERLRRINRTGLPAPRIECRSCGAGSA